MEEESKGTRAAKTSLKVTLFLVIAAILVGVWFLAGAITKMGNHNAQDKILSQEQEKIASQPANPSDGGGSQASVSPTSTPTATTAPSIDPAGEEVHYPQDGGEVPTEGADFGDKAVTNPNFGDENANAPYLEGWKDMPTLIGVTVSPMQDMSACYQTTKAYVICPLSGGYSIIYDTYHSGIFGVASTDAEFTDEQVAMFRESFPEGAVVPGANTLSGSSVLLRGQINDLS